VPVCQCRSAGHFRLALALGIPSRCAARSHRRFADTLGDYCAALTAYETAAALCDSDALARLEHKLGMFITAGSGITRKVIFARWLPGRGNSAGEQARLYADWSLTAHRRGQTQQALDLAPGRWSWPRRLAMCTRWPRLINILDPGQQSRRFGWGAATWNAAWPWLKLE